MGLNTYNASAANGYSFTLNAIAGLQVISGSTSASPVTTETGYDTNGNAVLFGLQDAGLITGTFSGRVLGSNGAGNFRLGSNIGATITPAMCALAGYSTGNGTVVCTGLSGSLAVAQFQKLDVQFSYFLNI